MKKLILLILSLLLVSCLDGTDTGNPGVDTGDNSTAPDPAMGNEIDLLISNSCLVIADCHTTTSEECASELINQTNIDTEIGLMVAEYSDLQSVSDALDDNTLTADSEKLSLCLQDIATLECTDTEVQNAYNSGAPNPYEGVAEMLPDSCEEIF